MAGIVKKNTNSDMVKPLLGLCYEKQKPATFTLREQPLLQPLIIVMPFYYC